jgi:hypothetical protein
VDLAVRRDPSARVYSGTQGTGKFSITVVDYNPIQRLLSERSMSCPAGAGDARAFTTGAWLLEE